MFHKNSFSKYLWIIFFSRDVHCWTWPTTYPMLQLCECHVVCEGHRTHKTPTVMMLTPCTFLDQWATDSAKLSSVGSRKPHQTASGKSSPLNLVNYGLTTQIGTSFISSVRAALQPLFIVSAMQWVDSWIRIQSRMDLKYNGVITPWN